MNETSATVTTRPAVPDDAVRLLEIARSDREGARFLAIDKGDKAYRLKKDCGSSQGHVIVAELQGKVVGGLHKSDRRGGGCYIQEVFVDPDVRGKHIGTLLCLHVITEGKCTGFEMKTLAENKAIAALGRKVGMQVLDATGARRVLNWSSKLSDVRKLRIIDAHVHMTPGPLLPRAQMRGKFIETHGLGRGGNDVSSVIKAMDNSGVSASVIIPYPLKGVCPEKSAQAVFRAQEEYPDRLKAIPLVSCEVRSWIRKGVVGFKEHSYFMDCDRHEYHESYCHMADAGSILLLHPHRRNKADRVRFICDKYPGLRVMLCHSGRDQLFSGREVLDVAKILNDRGNVYFETSTVWDAEVLRSLVNLVGPTRVLFGSDYPFSLLPGGPDRLIQREMAFVRAAELGGDELRQVMGENAKRLFSF